MLETKIWQHLIFKVDYDNDIFLRIPEEYIQENLKRQKAQLRYYFKKYIQVKLINYINRRDKSKIIRVQSEKDYPYLRLYRLGLYYKDANQLRDEVLEIVAEIDAKKGENYKSVNWKQILSNLFLVPELQSSAKRLHWRSSNTIQALPQFQLVIPLSILDPDRDICGILEANLGKRQKQLRKSDTRFDNIKPARISDAESLKFFIDEVARVYKCTLPKRYIKNLSPQKFVN